MAEQAGLAEPAVALHAGGAKAQPVRRRKLDALRTVEACMKFVGFVVEGSTQTIVHYSPSPTVLLERNFVH